MRNWQTSKDILCCAMENWVCGSLIYSACGEVCKCRVSRMSGTVGKMMEIACIHRM